MQADIAANIEAAGHIIHGHWRHARDKQAANPRIHLISRALQHIEKEAEEPGSVGQF